MAKDEAFCIELNTGPLYLGAKPETCHNGKENFQQLDAIFDNMNVFYVSAFAHGNQFAKNISQHEKLEKVLKSSLRGKSEIIPGLSYDGDDNFERGYFVKVPCDILTLAAKLKEDIKDEQVEISSFKSFTPTSDNGVLIKNEDFFRGNSSDMSAKWELTIVAPCSVHPAFLSRNTNSVYHDIQRCYDVLDEFKSREEVKELKEICGRYIKKEEKLPLEAKNSVIVIEGLDATGKTTLTKSLGKLLEGAKVLKSPPECLCHLRSKFDSYPQLLRRAFYSLGNYAFAKMVYDAANDGPVIVDRFWNSTAAYAIATDVGAGGRECLPPHGHWVYSWPSDLLKPSAVFLLTISDEQRRKRLKGRGSVKTDEEIRLEVSSPFRQRLEEAYNRMENPSMLKIDASGTEEDVLDKTIESLKSHGLI